jgi:PAS domain S-box-containing protein
MAKARQAEQRPPDEATQLRQALDALRESEERFRAVVDSANEGILVYDRNLNVVAGNLAAERVIGLPLAGLLGKPGFTSQLPCVREDGAPLTPEERPTRITIRSGEPLTGHVIGIRRAGGTFTWLSVNTGFLRRAGEPEYYGIVSTISDITERRRAEAALRESEERFRHTFELAGSGIAHVGMDGRLLRVNPRLGEILGYAPAELVGLSVKDVSHPEDRDITNAERDRMHAGLIPSFGVQKRYRHRDGRDVWVDLTVTMVRDADGRGQYDIAIFDDITERKQAEYALHHAHEELKRSNAELAQFAYVASHDLQEPLRMVSSYTQLLARRYGDRLDADAQEFMAYVVDGAARMKQLIEDLLAYSRIGTRAREFRQVAVDVPLRRAINNLRAAIEEASATVSYDALPVLVADDMQLAQLFQNLIGNALKFRSASVPRIHVCAAESDSEWIFAVRDNGIGIEPQYFERIFMVFQRLHGKEAFPGTGIGLAICKKVVERHDGRIWVESKPGEGATFHFTLAKQREATHG